MHAPSLRAAGLASASGERATPAAAVSVTEVTVVCVCVCVCVRACVRVHGRVRGCVCKARPAAQCQ